MLNKESASSAMDKDVRISMRRQTLNVNVHIGQDVLIMGKIPGAKIQYGPWVLPLALRDNRCMML